MKTFREYMLEETREQKLARIRSDAAAFDKKINAEIAAKQEPADIYAGSRHSDGKTVQVSNQQTVTPKKPKVGSVDKKLVARPVYHPDHETVKREKGIISGNKIQDRVPQQIPNSERDRPPERKDSISLQRQMSGDKAPQKQFGQDTKMKQLKIDRSHDTSFAKVNKPEPKIGSLVNKQSGYPAAKKPSLTPAESQRASSGGSYKIQPGDNPTKIAQKLGLKSVKELEAKNPGILKRAKRLKIGGTINR